MLIVVPVILVAVVLIAVVAIGDGRTTVSSPPSPLPPASPSAATPSSPTPTPTPRSPSPAWSTASFVPPTVEVSTERPRGAGPYADVPRLVRSKLYGITLGPWQCPAMDDPIAPDGAAFRPWMDGLVDCLMDRFGPAVGRASGAALQRPEIVYFSGTVTTPCGTMDDVVPFYCGSPQSMAIYVNPATVRTYDDAVRLGAVQIMVHEFAHHVQNQFGLLTAGYQADVEDRMQVSRRLELQAECVSWSQTTQLTRPRFGADDADEFWRWVSMDQDSAHGKATSYRYWYKRIAGKGDLGLCNTWRADRSRVA